LLLSRAAEGDEQIKQMLVGNILLVTPLEVWKCFGLFVAVGIVHFVLRKSFLLVSFDRDRAYKKGLRVRWWDFLFYALFGLVVTSFVRIAGVLLVFSYLIVPAVCGINLAGTIGKRLIIGWLIALAGGVAGLFFSFWWDLPSGAAIVCTFGVLLILVSIAGLLRRRPDQLAGLLRVIPSRADGNGSRRHRARHIKKNGAQPEINAAVMRKGSIYGEVPRCLCSSG